MSLTDQQLLEGLEFLYGGPGEDAHNYEGKIIITRKEHYCRSLYHEDKKAIFPKEKCVVEKCVLKDEG